MRKKTVYLVVPKKDAQYLKEPGAHIQRWFLGHKKERIGCKSVYGTTELSLP